MGTKRDCTLTETAGPSIALSVDELQRTLRDELYVADRGLAMSIYLA